MGNWKPCIDFGLLIVLTLNVWNLNLFSGFVVFDNIWLGGIFLPCVLVMYFACQYLDYQNEWKEINKRKYIVSTVD